MKGNRQLDLTRVLFAVYLLILVWILLFNAVLDNVVVKLNRSS